MKKLPKINSEVGAVPILLLAAAVGLLVFLFITNTFSFKDRLFGNLFPKPPSHAQEVSSSVPDEILVKFKAGVPDKVKDNIRAAHGLKKESEITQIDVELDKVPEKAKEKIIEALSHNPRVEYAEANFIVKAEFAPNDPYYVSGFQWNMNKISAPQAWDVTQGNANVTVAILDTGIDVSHPDLAGKVVNGSTSSNDVYGHGTHVAGIAAANTNNSIGVAGLGFNSTLDNIKVMNDTGTGSSSSAASGITLAADHGAKVINMSFGGSGSCPSTIQNAVNYAWNKGVILAAAAGNNANSLAFWPAICQNVIAVASTDTSDSRSPYSNYGDWVDVAAPGGNVYSTIIGGSYGAKAGTSMASPHVAGEAGLIFAANPSLTNQQVVDIITSSVDNVGTYNIGPNNTGGRINASKAVYKAKDLTPPPADTTLPAISITSPKSFATVSGVVDITVNASDNVAVVDVNYGLDSSGSSIGSTTTSPFSFSWDTTKNTNGTHTLFATAVDGSGNHNLAYIPVTINNSTSPDTTPPTTSITSPTDGSTVSGNVNIQASATDNIALSTISIFVDGNVVTSCSVSGTSSSCSYSLDTTQISNGSHTILSKALDSSNNLGQSSTVTVNVQNVTPTPAPTPISTPSPAPAPSPTPSDITLPTVSITSPLNGGIVKVNSKVNIQASASDNAGISKVEFYVGGSLKCSSTLSADPYSCTWPVPGKKNASYTITVKAYDGANNSSSASITVKAQ